MDERCHYKREVDLQQAFAAGGGYYDDNESNAPMDTSGMVLSSHCSRPFSSFHKPDQRFLQAMDFNNLLIIFGYDP